MSDDKIGIKDIHQTLWRCRDFELANLWQRSVFLTAFLVLCFTAYGIILNKIPLKIEPENYSIFYILNGFAYIISLLGIIFSIFWIKMGKGSKAWYEIYESAIYSFENDTAYVSEELNKVSSFEYSEGKNISLPPLNNRIFSSQAGAYSVSKINIAIGQVFVLFWSIIGISHTIIVSLTPLCTKHLTSLGIIILGILLLVTIFIVFSHPRYFKSNTLLNKHKPSK